MASDPEDGGSRIWRGVRNMIFGDDAEATLRNQIEDAIDEAEGEPFKRGDLSPTERQMLRNLLHFGDRTAGEICVTRGDIISAPQTSTMAELAKAFADAGHSRLPITGENLDEIIGMVHIKDVFNAYFENDFSPTVDEIVRAPLFIPESMGVLDLLARMRTERVHLAIVVDEFGGTEGLVTIEDVVEEIVGEIEDEDTEDEEIIEIIEGEEGYWDVLGSTEIDKIERLFDIELEDDEYTTVAGMITSEAGYVPKTGETLTLRGLEARILRADDKRVSLVRLRRHGGGSDSDLAEAAA
jgi:CBS domain containing-hemolysin-like protein